MRHFGSEILRGLAATSLLPHRFRPTLLRASGYRLGSDILLYARLRTAGVGSLTIASNVFINSDCYFDLQASVRIESGVRIGDHVRLITSTHEIGDSERRGAAGLSRPIVVGRGSWLGSGVVVLPGVEIAPGCIIAAGAVLTRSTRPDGLYGGVPARRLRELTRQDSAAAIRGQEDRL